MGNYLDTDKNSCWDDLPFDFSTENNSCEIGYELMPEFQGQGIMKESAEEVINYAFQTLTFQKNSSVYSHGE